jgi:hypothetical protein
MTAAKTTLFDDPTKEERLPSLPGASPATSVVPLLDAVTIDHGPRDLLGRFFLLADRAIRNQGLRLAYCGDFSVLKAINEANRASWYPLLPCFDVRGGAGPHNAYFFLAYDAEEIVATQVGRVYDMPHGFTEHCRSLRLMYDDPAKAIDGESCTLLGDAGRAGEAIRGRVVFSGGTWCKPGKARGRGFAGLLARLSRSFALARFGTEWTVSSVRSSHIAGGLMRAYGYTRLDYEWKWRSPIQSGAPSTTEDPIGLVHMPRDELLSDLATYMTKLSPSSQAAE